MESLYNERIFIETFVTVFAEHFTPLLEQIGKLEEALYNIQFEQHWLEAQTDRQAIGNYFRFNFMFILLFTVSLNTIFMFIS